MTFHRNFTYWIDKRKWKFYFLVLSLELNKPITPWPDASSGRLSHFNIG